MFACTKLHKEMKFETDAIQVLVLSWLASFVSRLWKDDRCRPKKPTFKNICIQKAGKQVLKIVLIK